MRALKTLIRASAAEGEPALRVPSGPAQLERLEALKSELHAEFPNASVSKWDRRQVLIVRVDLPDQDGPWRYGGTSSLHVYFAGDELQISDGYRAEGAPLSGLEQLRRLVAAVREELLAQRRREQKRDKIRKLKQRAIETQVDALAARLGFAYAIEPMHTKVKLIVRLDAQNGISVDIPHKRIQEVIAELPRLLDALRDIYRSGARFKVISTRYVRGFRDPRPA